MKNTDLPPTDFEHLEESIRTRVMVEIFHNMGMISNKVYHAKYSENAEVLDRDFKIWQELKESK